MCVCLFQTPTTGESTPHKMKVLSGPSEIAANVIDNPFEASVELGSEVALSGSQNDATGQKLMQRHVGSLGNLPLQLGEKKAGSAFFKPIASGFVDAETDETKLGVSENLKLVKPTPTIRLNDAELSLSPSPGSPRAVPLGETSVTGFVVPEVDPSDEVRAIFERGGLVKKGSLEAGPPSLSGRDSPSSRRDSINQLQRLQQHNRVPRLGGKVHVHVHVHVYKPTHCQCTYMYIRIAWNYMCRACPLAEEVRTAWLHTGFFLGGGE